MNFEAQDTQSAIKFRPTKKRKTLRQRASGDSDEQPQPQPQTRSESPTVNSSRDHDQETSISAALRARNARKSRLQGVAFRANDTADPITPNATQEAKFIAKSIPGRFMHQTGLVSTLNDKHMTDYIESRLNCAAPAPSHAEPAPQPTPQSQAVQPTQHGRLVEVDLPSHLVRTDDRKRKAESRPRRRNRRGSDDVKRDQLVEAFLHENKLDVYDVPMNKPAPTPGDDRSADDRMAEEFRQRYLDEVAARRQRKKPIPQTRQQQQQQQQQAGEVLKGPKLGGSRNQRAAVRDMLLKQEREKVGKRG